MGRFFKEETREQLRLLAKVSSLGISIVLATVIGAGLGYWIDEHWQTGSHWGAGIGLLIGIAAGFNNIYVLMKQTKDK